MRDPEQDDAEFVNDIAPDVMRVLAADRFFERLDDLFCPLDPSIPAAKCGHGFENSLRILRELGMDSDDVDDVIAVLHSKGGCCDCEVLYNVAEECRLKAQYWKAKALELSDGKRQIESK
jgi:hypothetical protein